MKNKAKKQAVRNTETDDAKILTAQTKNNFDECRMLMSRIESRPLSHDPTYSNLLDRARHAFDEAMTAYTSKALTPDMRNAAVSLARASLEHEAQLHTKLIRHSNDRPTSIKGENDGKKTGGKKRAYHRGTITNKTLATAFNDGRIELDPGVYRGECDEAKIKQWNIKYYDYEHRNKFGYYAELRTNPKLKDQLTQVINAWRDYFSEYRDQFKVWRRAHPGEHHSKFKYRRPKPISIKRDIADPKSLTR